MCVGVCTYTCVDMYFFPTSLYGTDIISMNTYGITGCMSHDTFCSFRWWRALVVARRVFAAGRGLFWTCGTQAVGHGGSEPV